MPEPLVTVVGVILLVTVPWTNVAISLAETRSAGLPDNPAIRHALSVIDQKVNPVRVVGLPEIRDMYARAGAVAPPGLNAFRAPGRPDDPNIYVNEESAVYRLAAKKPSAFTMLKLGATLVHEQVHNSDGEAAAYRVQSDFVRSRWKSVPSGQERELCQYLQSLDARAQAFALVERRSRAR